MASGVILDQHAEEAAFLWLQRDRAVTAPHYTLDDLARLDERVEAHLDGLRVAGEDGWAIAHKQLAFKKPGEVFAATALAFDSGDARRIQAVLDVALTKPPLARALVSALGWLPTKSAIERVEPMLADKNPALRRVAIAAAAAHRHHPRARLVESLRDADPALRARALLAFGQLGDVQSINELRQHLQSHDVGCKFAAAWSIARFTPDQNAVRALQHLELDVPAYRSAALPMLVR